MEAPSPHLALLRGINVGGKHMLPMKVLLELFREANCLDVRSYLQSGNILFSAPPDLATSIPTRVSARIREGFGFDAPVQVKSRMHVAEVVRGNPFLAEEVPEGELHVLFLADPPDPARLAELDARRSPPDSFRLGEQALYLRLPNGVARSKFTNDYFDSKLRTTSTARNWRTVTALLALMDEG